MGGGIAPNSCLDTEFIRLCLFLAARKLQSSLTNSVLYVASGWFPSHDVDYDDGNMVGSRQVVVVTVFSTV